MPEAALQASAADCGCALPCSAAPTSQGGASPEAKDAKAKRLMELRRSFSAMASRCSLALPRDIQFRRP